VGSAAWRCDIWATNQNGIIRVEHRNPSLAMRVAKRPGKVGTDPNADRSIRRRPICRAYLYPKPVSA
jgi:hypothetical protein